MQIAEQAAKATTAVFAALDLSPQEGQAEEVHRIIENAIIDRLRECESRHAEAAAACCPEDKSLAQKITAEMRRSNQALIANLSALR